MKLQALIDKTTRIYVLDTKDNYNSDDLYSRLPAVSEFTKERVFTIIRYSEKRAKK